MAFIMKTIEEEFAKIHVSILFEFFFWMGITVVEHRGLFFSFLFFYIFCQKFKDNHAFKIMALNWNEKCHQKMQH